MGLPSNLPLFVRQQYFLPFSAVEALFRHIANLSLHDAQEWQYDNHWRPQTMLCNPCAVNYDFVVRFESMIEDGNHLLKYLQKNDPEEKVALFDDSHPASTDDEKTARAFEQISTKTQDQLKKLYSDDFNILGYIP